MKIKLRRISDGSTVFQSENDFVQGSDDEATFNHELAELTSWCKKTLPTDCYTVSVINRTTAATTGTDVMVMATVTITIIEDKHALAFSLAQCGQPSNVVIE